MKIKVWDIPTRLFHWLLVACIAGVYATSRNEWYLEYHALFGYSALGLVIFRILWGFAGGRFSRFAQFIKGWPEIVSYLKASIKLKPPRALGHNPAVGWIVIIMLLVVVTLAVTGVITYGGEENLGYWAGYFSFEAADVSRGIHVTLAYSAVALIVLHICAALFHDFVLKENIILSMITGDKEDDESWAERVSHLVPEGAFSITKTLVWGIVAIMGGLALVYLPPEGRTDFDSKRDLAGAGLIIPGKPVNSYQIFRDECAASCHNAFHPSLLPADSWAKLMAGVDRHFGENLALDGTTRERVSAYLTENSAERSATEASKKMFMSIEKGVVYTRITDVPYWVEKHSEISKDVFAKKSITSKNNCVACHPGAEAGSFEDRDIFIPNSR